MIVNFKNGKWIRQSNYVIGDGRLSVCAKAMGVDTSEIVKTEEIESRHKLPEAETFIVLGFNKITKQNEQVADGSVTGKKSFDTANEAVALANHMQQATMEGHTCFLDGSFAVIQVISRMKIIA